MRLVNLPAGGTTSSVGLGCGGLRVSEGRAHAQRVINTAIDEGVRYVDVARSYGYGMAEAVLRDALCTRREDITVATKVGITPPRQPHIRVVQAFAGPIVRGLPVLHRALRKRADSAVTHGSFDPGSVRSSVECSLTALGTDHLDILLLHEAKASDVREELLETLDALVTAGKVLTVGLATQSEDTREILAQHPHRFRVTNVPDADIPSVAVPPPPHSRLQVTHSVVRRFLAWWQAATSKDPTTVTAWSDRVGADLNDRMVLVDLLLQRALRDNPGGVVLFSTNRPEHARRAATAESRQDVSQLQEFGALVRNSYHGT